MYIHICTHIYFPTRSARDRRWPFRPSDSYLHSPLGARFADFHPGISHAEIISIISGGLPLFLRIPPLMNKI